MFYFRDGTFDNSDRKRHSSRCRANAEEMSDSESEDSVNIVMEVDDPVVELDEFAWIKSTKKTSKMPETNSEFTRKRSYSKEDVKIGPAMLETGTVSPEFVISDEDEYELNEKDSINWIGNNQGSPIYRKCLTGPTEACNNKNSSKILRKRNREDINSPTKYTKYTWNTWYSSNLHSEWEPGLHIYHRKQKWFNNTLDKDEPLVPLKLWSLNNEKYGFRSPLPQNEAAQYEKVIQMLMGKISYLSNELDVSKTVIKQQNNLINAYKIKNEEIETQNRKLYVNTMKATNKVQSLISNTENTNHKQHIQTQQLTQENELLRKILQLKNANWQTDSKEQVLKEEEIKYQSPTQTKRDIEVKDLYGDNPFNTKTRVQSTKVIPQFSLNSEEIIKQAVSQNRKRQKRERSGSFYFESNTPNQEEEKEEQDWLQDKISKTPVVSKQKGDRKIFSFDKPEGRLRWEAIEEINLSDKSESSSDS